MTWRIVDTDNFNGDYPNEKFVGEVYERADEAQAEADRLNDRYSGDRAPRWYKAVGEDYQLAPGLEE